MTNKISKSCILAPENLDSLINLCGQFNENLKFLAYYLKIKLYNRGFKFTIEAQDEKQAIQIIKLLHNIYQDIFDNNKIVNKSYLEFQLHQHKLSQPKIKRSQDQKILYTPNLSIKLQGKNQQQYIKNIHDNCITFGIGPAGTGKTFLAVAYAVIALMREEVQHIVLVRPAIEAGEKLGFLPGDLSQKVDPYLRPLYDALYQFLDLDIVNNLIRKSKIEVAPLAYMRGRTLNNMFVILDEAQNTTCEQMKMFLTRIGFGSKIVINGDITQIDLPNKKNSGLIQVQKILQKISNIAFSIFDKEDIVRHNIVQKIITAYETANK